MREAERRLLKHTFSPIEIDGTDKCVRNYSYISYVMLTLYLIGLQPAHKHRVSLCLISSWEKRRKRKLETKIIKRFSILKKILEPNTQKITLCIEARSCVRKRLGRCSIVLSSDERKTPSPACISHHQCYGSGSRF